MKKVLLWTWFFFMLLTLGLACQKSEIADLHKRLDNFRMILPEALRGQFDQKNYPSVVLGIDSLLKVDSDFKIKYEKLKDNEAINVFTPEEVVSFFDEYFVRRIEKVKNK
jgi:hypothetical protein